MMVKDLIDVNGGWRFELLLPWLPNNLINKLHAIMPPSNDSNDDKVAWSGTSDGDFSIASAYTLLCQFSDEAWETDWLRIWMLRVPERIKTFIWLIRQDSLLTNYWKNKMHNGEPWCNHCVDVVEDTLHVLRDCPLAKSVWKVHGDNKLRPLQPWHFILRWVLQYFEADVSGIVIVNWQKMKIAIAWQRPEEGWLSLNTDGASRGHSVAGCRGLLRNLDGHWLGGATKLVANVDSSVYSMTGGTVVGWRLIQEIRRLLTLD
ncbi:ribonuclease H [Trifolium pratense]|uniref:Ribonuclease H n=1 Tax=Trifolium pratense TaxID=57577 RepID=A0A2K3P114_TRIPR|nr:ribonuclease H [Trifolium pratense]